MNERNDTPITATLRHPDYVVQPVLIVRERPDCAKTQIQFTRNLHLHPLRIIVPSKYVDRD